MKNTLDLTLVERAERLNWLHWGEPPAFNGLNGLASSHPHLFRVYLLLRKESEHSDEAGQVALSLWRAQLRYELGSPLATLDALHICQDYKITLPDNFLVGLRGQVIDGLFQRSDAQRGRNNSLWGRLRKLLAQQKQAKLYQIIRSWQREQNRRLRNKRSRSPLSAAPISIRLFIPDILDKFEPLFDTFESKKRLATEAAELAHILLRGTWANAEPRTITDAATLINRHKKQCHEAIAAVLQSTTRPQHLQTVNDLRSSWINEWSFLHARTRRLIEDAEETGMNGQLPKSEIPSRSSRNIPTILR